MMPSNRTSRQSLVENNHKWHPRRDGNKTDTLLSVYTGKLVSVVNEFDANITIYISLLVDGDLISKEPLKRSTEHVFTTVINKDIPYTG